MLWVKLLEELAQQDPQILFYISEVYMGLDMFREAMSILAQALLEFPQMTPLLLQQVRCLYELK